MSNEMFNSFLDFLVPPIGSASFGGACAWGTSVNRDALKKEIVKVLQGELVEPHEDLNEKLLQFKRHHPKLFIELTNALLHDFFTHPDVKIILGQAIPAPFPKGYDVPNTDWSVLEPVFQRDYDTR